MSRENKIYQDLVFMTKQNNTLENTLFSINNN